MYNIRLDLHIGKGESKPWEDGVRLDKPQIKLLIPGRTRNSNLYNWGHHHSGGAIQQRIDKPYGPGFNMQYFPNIFILLCAPNFKFKLKHKFAVVNYTKS